jgi:O-antigen ligase
MFYEPIYAGKFVRARSFIEESGFFALYLNLLGPIAIYWTAKSYSRILLFFVSTLFVVSFIVTFSTAGIFSLLISSMLTSAYFISDKIIKKELSSYIIFKGIIIISIIFAIFIIVSFQMPELLMPIVNKIFITDTSEGSRLARWERSIQHFIDSPIIGIGPGEVSVKYGTGTVNWYLEMLTENGLIAFLIMFSFMVIIYFRIIFLLDEIKFVYFLCFTNGIIHYTFISNYWYPWIWLIILLIQIESLKTSYFRGVYNESAPYN